MNNTAWRFSSSVIKKSQFSKKREKKIAVLARQVEEKEIVAHSDSFLSPAQFTCQT
jgi:hypothetical protein